MVHNRSIVLRRFIDRWYGVLLLSSIFTLCMIYHYVVPLNAILYNTGNAGNDCGQMIWNLWSVNEAITSGHNPYQTKLLYYPTGANLSHHTLAAGFFPVTFLVKLLSRGDPLYPIYVARVVTLLCFTLILACSFLFLREIGCTRLASAIAAISYAFGDFYLKHALHLNLIAGFFIPLTALFLVRSYKRPASLNLVFFALASGCAVYFTEFALYVYIGAALFALLMLLFSEERHELMKALRTVGPKRLALSVAAFVLVIAPFLLNLARDHIIKPLAIESSIYSANLAAFFVPGPQHSLLDHVFGPLNSRITTGAGVFEEFIGFTLIVFGFVGIFVARRTLVLCASLSALAFYALSLGPTLKVFGADTGLSLPYALLMNIPPFDSSRTPVRFVVMATFFLMIPAALGLSSTQQWLTRWGRLGESGMLILLALTVTEAYSPIPRQAPFAPPQNLQQIVSGPVFNIPLRPVDGYAALLEVFHHQPIATGYIARNSPDRQQRFEELKQVYDRGGPWFCERVSEMGFKNIVVTRGDVTVPLELARCRIAVVDLRSEVLWEPESSTRAKTDDPEFPAYSFGRRIDFSSVVAEGYLWYGWSGAEPSSRWTNRGEAAIVFSVGAVRACVLHLNLAPFLAPPALVSQRVQLKLNGKPLATVEFSQPQPREYQFELARDLLRKDNVLSFDLPDAQSPKSMGVSEDGRLLGINVQWMQIDQKD
jgi:hypothetical protein